MAGGGLGRANEPPIVTMPKDNTHLCVLHLLAQTFLTSHTGMKLCLSVKNPRKMVNDTGFADPREVYSIS
jgi:hypothetical protein